MDAISQRAARCGVETRYRDAFGHERVADRDAVADLIELLSARGDPPRRLIDRTVVLRHGRPTRLRVHAPARSKVRWEILADTGSWSGEGRGSHVTLPDDLPIGTFRLRVDVRLPKGEHQEDATLLIAPERAYQGDGSRRMWVLAAQLYGVRSQRNWGHGDFSDLAELIELAADCGAAGVALNPLHALFDDRADEPSPYSPNSRQFLNPLYIDVEAVPEFSGLQAAGLAQDVAKLRHAELVQYRAVAEAKIRGLELAYAVFRREGSEARRREFDAFRRDRGEALSRFACFEWLRRRHAGPWQDWPREWRCPDEPTLARLRQANTEAIEFFAYLQWIADQQLDRCRARARERGLPIGLYLDIAVGVRPDGFDAWSDQDSIMPAVAIGAPPDALNLAGQNWGLAGLDPGGLERHGFEPFRRMLAASMRYAGAVRLDHVLGLKRLYLIPRDRPADRGVYVRFPFEALLAVTAQESMQSRCIVIGEDLGTVPETLREELADWGVWSYQVMLFERTPDGSFRAPEDYRENALVTFATHDLPTFAGWTQRHDLAVKTGLGLDPGESDEDRALALTAMRDTLSRRGIGSLDFVSVTQYLAAAPSRLLVVALEDVLDLKDQVNVPGTVNEHPNWRRRLPVPLDQLREQPVLAAVADAMRAAGRSQTSRRRV
jgi:4-alpha-glucanotransferase